MNDTTITFTDSLGVTRPSLQDCHNDVSAVHVGGKLFLPASAEQTEAGNAAACGGAQIYTADVVEELRALILQVLRDAAPSDADVARDAARYQFLRAQDNEDCEFAVVMNPHFDLFDGPQSLDAAIDAAMSATAPTGGA